MRIARREGKRQRVRGRMIEPWTDERDHRVRGRDLKHPLNRIVENDNAGADENQIGGLAKSTGDDLFGINRGGQLVIEERTIEALVRELANGAFPIRAG